MGSLVVLFVLIHLLHADAAVEHNPNQERKKERGRKSGRNKRIKERRVGEIKEMKEKRKI